MKLAAVLRLFLACFGGLFFTLAHAQEPPSSIRAIKKTLTTQNAFETWNTFPFKVKEQIDSALALSNELLNSSPDLLAKSHYVLGKRYFSTGEYASSTKLLTKAAQELREQKLFTEEADTYHFLGLNAGRLNQNDKATDYFQKAILLAQQHNDTFNIINGLHGLGNLANKIEDYEQAMKHFNRALDLGLASHDSLSFSYSYDFLSQTVGQKGDPKKALEYQLKALDIRRALGDQFALAISINNVGECYRLLNEPAKAKRYFLEAQQKAQSIGFRDLEAYIYQILTELAEEEGNYQEALLYSKQHKILSDSLFNAKMASEVAEIEGKYQLTEKEKQITEAKLKSERQSEIMIGILMALLAVSAIAYSIFTKKKEEKKRLEAEAVASLEEERLRIARDLHDHLGPELSLISSRLDMMSYQQEGGQLGQLADVTRSAMDQLRDTIWSIRGDAITLFDFAAKVREYANKRLAGTPLRFVDSCSNQQAVLSPNQALNLFRVCQEAINNAAKYAKASEIELSISCENNLYIQLKDNGIGFEVNSASAGYGLRNMRERIEELGGVFQLDSSVSGTIIQLTLPISKNESQV